MKYAMFYLTLILDFERSPLDVLPPFTWGALRLGVAAMFAVANLSVLISMLIDSVPVTDFLAEVTGAKCKLVTCHHA